MTPFDPIALLAMLQAFYPVVGPAALSRARRERPDYFSAGALIGTSGDKLRLPDGRIFDLIFDVNGPFTRWQAIDVGTGPGADVDDPFALEAGPLMPIDLSAWVSSGPSAPVFVPLMAGAVAELGAADVMLGTAASDVAHGSDKGPIQDDWARFIDPALEHLAAEGYALNAADPAAELVVLAGQSSAADANAGEFGEPAPPEI